MISSDDRHLTLQLLDTAVNAGARQSKACKILEIDERTIRRWKRQLNKTNQLKDLRKEAAQMRAPANKLTEQEKWSIYSSK